MISIIVPVYNGENTIRPCLDSLLDQEISQSHEILCVDNDSTDKTLQMLNEYDGKIKILHERKRGPAAARNCGLQNVSGEIIAFTDADCTVAKNWLANLIRSLEDPRVGIAGGKILSVQPCNHIEKFGEDIHDHSKAIESGRPPYAITMNWASRFSVLKEASFFDENLLRCEDVDLAYRIYQKGYHLNFDPEAIVYHRNESSYRGLSYEGFLHGYYSIQLLKKHRPFVRQFGHRRWNPRSYNQLCHHLIGSFSGVQRNHSRCEFVFNSGKKLGKVIGSLRWRYVDL
jgi:glycosyltransferase involved in cell wall biosynthesis